MWKDPIVAETRSIRNEYGCQFEHDINAIFDDLLKKQSEHLNRVVSLPPRRAKSSKNKENQDDLNLNSNGG